MLFVIVWGLTNLTIADETEIINHKSNQTHLSADNILTHVDDVNHMQQMKTWNVSTNVLK